MRLSSRLLSATALSIFAVSTVAAHAATIVTNGDFSSGLSGWTASGPGSGTTPDIGVTVITLGTGGDATGFGDVIPNAPGGFNHGVYFVSDNAVQSLTQSITLAASTNYTLSFDLWATNSGAPNTFNFTLTDSVGAVASSTFGNTAGPGVTPVTVGAWTPETLSFTSGAAGSYLLDFSFLSGSTPAKDVVLADVGIIGGTPANPVPEPSSIALLGTGILGLAGAARRKFSR